MRLPPLETDFAARVLLPLEISVPVATEPANETVGGRMPSRFVAETAVFDLVAGALHSIKENNSPIIKERARDLLVKIHKILSFLEEAGVAVHSLPVVQAFSGEDDSILVEWIFPNYRIGFTLEPAVAESGWYLVSNKELGDISASGLLFNENADEKVTNGILIWLLSFAVTNS